VNRSPELGAAGRWLAPALSIVGLLIIAFVTISLLGNNVPFLGSNTSGTGNGNGDVPADATPAP